ncbi:MAG: PDC sensor domain-containing protein [Gammaproteobacteria bacterium]|nr:PDC sensor domain-containing protein [Gammaproteobacteria bacterium]
MRLKHLLALLVFLPGLLQAESELTAEEIEDLLGVKIRFATHMAFNPSIVRAVDDQNDQAIALAEIKQRDEVWKGAGGELNSLIRQITQNDVARYFQRRVENNSAIDEVFLTDNQGANVAAYPPTSDYWQGDEEKWTASYNNGNGVVFIGPLEYDESTQKTQVQISAPVISKDETIGVLVLGVSVDYLQAKQ